jgi:hypothetical protein
MLELFAQIGDPRKLAKLNPLNNMTSSNDHWMTSSMKATKSTDRVQDRADLSIL